MNNHIDRLYFLMFNNNIIVVESNLSAFVRLVKEQDIGVKFGLSTFRTRFLEIERFNHTDVNGRVYWFQKIEFKESS